MLKIVVLLAVLSLAAIAAPSTSAATDASGCGGLIPLARCVVGEVATEFCAADIQFAEPGPQYKCHPDYETQDA